MRNQVSTNGIVILMSLLILFLPFMGGCSSTKKIDPSTFGSLPSAIEIAEQYNERIEGLDTLWARTSIRVRGTYEDGEVFEEQGTGHFQTRRPSDVSFTIRKLGELYFSFGANSEKYWAFNMVDSDHKMMTFGRVDQASPSKSASIGMVVHPGQLSALMGLVPIELSQAGGVRWSPDGKSYVIQINSERGRYSIWIDSRTHRAIKSEVFGDDGEIIATTTLTRYIEARVPNHQSIGVPGKVEVRFPNNDNFLRLELDDAAVKTIRSRVFDPEKLERGFRTHEQIDLDQEPEMIEDGA